MESEKRGIIYGLCDPITKELRYVGLTSQRLEKRFYQHCAPCNYKINTPVTNWIRGLRKRELKPEIFVIEEVPVSELAEAEISWISYFKFIGARLLNISAGGDIVEGKQKEALVKGRIQAWLEKGDETRAKIAEKAKINGYSERNLAQLARMSEANKGSKISDEHKAIISQYNQDKIISDISKHRISVARLGVCTEAQRKHLDDWNEKQRGKPHTGIHKENHRLAISKLNMEKANEIRALLNDGQLTMVQIGKMYGVSSGTIQAIKKGQTWKN